MTLSSRAAATAIASLLLVGTAFAQSTAPAAAPPASTKAPVTHSETSLKCSQEADAKGLHGKERKKFRSACKKAEAKPS